MKNYFYVAANLHNAVRFINENTDWVQVTNVSFRNGDEHIIVITEFMRIRGRHVDGVYIDHTFGLCRDCLEFEKRFAALGIVPTTLEGLKP